MKNKRLDYFKLDYILKAKTHNCANYDEYEMLVQEDSYRKRGDEIEITYKGIFENIGFCIDKYFQTHHYFGEKSICQIGSIAEVELFYNSKQDIKFTVFKIRLLKSLDIFNISEEIKTNTNRLQSNFNKLALKINQKLHQEFKPSNDQVKITDFSSDVWEFETYRDHEKEHQQLVKIVYYLK